MHHQLFMSHESSVIIQQHCSYSKKLSLRCTPIPNKHHKITGSSRLTSPQKCPSIFRQLYIQGLQPQTAQKYVFASLAVNTSS